MRLIASFLFVMLMNCCGAAEPAGIPVVASFEEILKQQPTTFQRAPRADGSKFPEFKLRFGVESGELHPGCAALVYLVTENARGEDVHPDTGECALGPLEIKFYAEADVHQPLELRRVLDADALSWSGTALFCQSIAAVEPGAYVLDLREPGKSTVIARAKLQVVAEPGQPWTALGNDQPIKHAQQDAPVINLTGPQTELAIPRMDGTQPWIIDGETADGEKIKLYPATLLPALMDVRPQLERLPSDAERAAAEALIASLGSDSFDEREAAFKLLRKNADLYRTVLEAARKKSADQEIQLRLARLLDVERITRLLVTRRGNQFLMSMDRKINIAYMQQHLLARWWVNGKPHRVKNAQIPAVNLNGGAMLDNRCRLDLAIDYAALGAHTGDRVAVEFMYCPEGWRSPDLLMRAELEHFKEDTEYVRPQLPLRSNRIEWTAP